MIGMLYGGILRTKTLHIGVPYIAVLRDWCSAYLNPAYWSFLHFGASCIGVLYIFFLQLEQKE